MKVLHLSPGRYGGGIETMLVTLARERGKCPAMAPEFGVCFSDGSLAAELREVGAPVHSVGAVRARFPWQIVRARARLRRLLEAERFDAVVNHTSWTHALFGGVVRQARVPLVFFMHNRATVAGRNFMERRAGRLVPDLVICNSRFTADSLPLLFGDLLPPHGVIHCPVTPPAPAADRAAVRHELGVPEPARVIAQVGWMEPGKGHILHLEALASLRDAPDWRCWMIGGAETAAQAQCLARLKERAGTLGIADRIRFLGQRRDVSRLLAAADVFCQPNIDPEAFGIVFVEALQAGLPVISARHGGVLEIVDETCGRFFTPGDSKALAVTLEGLLRDDALRAALGAAAPARARQISDPGTVLPALERALSGAAGH